MPPSKTKPKAPARSETVSVGQWLVTMLLASIPVVNIVLLIVWALGSDVPPSKANWARATLLWAVLVFLVGVLLYLLLFVVIGVTWAVGTRAAGG